MLPQHKQGTAQRGFAVLFGLLRALGPRNDGIKSANPQ